MSATGTFDERMPHYRFRTEPAVTCASVVVMRWVGEGSDLWRVRVDLFAEDESPDRVRIASEAMLREVPFDDGVARPGGGVAADQGRGIEGRPVVGLTFWVKADDVGQAATTAVEAARRAGTASRLGSDLYDVVLIPSAAVARADDATFPPMPD